MVVRETAGDPGAHEFRLERIVHTGVVEDVDRAGIVLHVAARRIVVLPGRADGQLPRRERDAAAKQVTCDAATEAAGSDDLVEVDPVEVDPAVQVNGAGRIGEAQAVGVVVMKRRAHGQSQSVRAERHGRSVPVRGVSMADRRAESGFLRPGGSAASKQVHGACVVEGVGAVRVVVVPGRADGNQRARHRDGASEQIVHAARVETGRDELHFERRHAGLAVHLVHPRRAGVRQKAAAGRIVAVVLHARDDAILRRCNRLADVVPDRSKGDGERARGIGTETPLAVQIQRHRDVVVLSRDLRDEMAWIDLELQRRRER